MAAVAEALQAHLLETAGRRKRTNTDSEAMAAAGAAAREAVAVKDSFCSMWRAHNGNV